MNEVPQRWVVRYRLADGRATDVVGDLVGDGDRLTIRPDDRPDVVVEASTVLARKRVPARTVRPSSSVWDVGRIIDRGWPGLERVRLGGWVLKASEGFTGRANSALPVGDPGLPMPTALEHVERFYADRGLPSKVAVPTRMTGDWPELDAELARRGYLADETTLVMLSRLRPMPAPAVPDGLRLQLNDTPGPQWLSLCSYRGSALPPGAVAVLTSAVHQVFATVHDGDLAVGCARLAVVDGWAGITALQVAERGRRRGIARWLLTTLLARSGADVGYVQVQQANTAAVALYSSVGFDTHHRYHYRTLDG